MFLQQSLWQPTFFTDKRLFLTILSVNGSDFAKCSASHHLLNRCTWPRLRSKRWFLRFARNLRPHCFGKGNWVEHFLNFGWFCSTFGTARAKLESAVEHFSKFLRFCSTFGTARAEFGVSGRTFFQFFEILFYFRSRAGQIWRVS